MRTYCRPFAGSKVKCLWFDIVLKYWYVYRPNAIVFLQSSVCADILSGLFHCLLHSGMYLFKGQLINSRHGWTFCQKSYNVLTSN